MHVKRALVVFLFLGVCLRAQAQVEIRDGYVTTSDNIRIHYLEGGAASSGPALLLVPGWRLAAEIWRGQIEVLAQGRRVIAIDPRSTGLSTMTVEGNSPEVRARDIAEVARSLHLEDFVLAGWSQGVQDVAAYVSQFGTSSIAGFILVDSPIMAGPEEVKLHPDATALAFHQMGLYAKYPQEASEGLVDAICAKPLDPKTKKRIVELASRTPPPTGVTMLVMDMFAVDRRSAIGKFDKPTLVLASSRSALLDAQKEMAQRLPRAELSVFDSGHAIFLDEPVQFSQRVSVFLRAL
jgi:non-heme chloroperoxidase